MGIVTALPWECAAARLFVGDLRDLSVQGDPNHYGSGWMPSKDPSRPHRVVVALQVQDGTRNASALCSDMARSFPELQVFIMCGIAGGVPAAPGAERRVRLGDILSATAGVVDYDHVRSVDGQNVLRRTVEGLSKALLRADRELEVKSLAGDDVWRGPLDETAVRVPRFLPLSQGANLRELGHAVGAGVSVAGDVADSAGGTGGTDATGAGDVADARRAHPVGWPQVHRGAIGSADRLVRDVVLRDALASRYGILGVEMEGSGIAVGADLHERHWYMVRGVADYCDNRTKSDAWHPYASLAAAAYVRALLAECQPFGVGVRRDVGSVSRVSGVSGLQAIVQALLDLPVVQDDYQRRAVLAQLPERIRTVVPDNVVARLHVVALVRTCEDSPDGRDALLDVLRLTLGADSPQFLRVEGVILDNWSRG